MNLGRDHAASNENGFHELFDALLRMKAYRVIVLMADGDEFSAGSIKVTLSLTDLFFNDRIHRAPRPYPKPLESADRPARNGESYHRASAPAHPH